MLDAIAPLGLEVRTGTGLSSVVAVLRGGRPGPAVLLRGDMDALPVTEDSGEPFTSERDGVMHACGHDLHVAGLVGAARLLADRRDELAGDVVLMFQPGEEGDHGARLMIEEGVLDAAGSRVVAAYGLHVMSSVLPTGLVASRAGTMLAAADSVVVTVHGRGGHGSMPHLAADPVPVAAEIVLALQAMVTRQFDVFDPVVVTVGKIAAGTTNNVIASTAVLEATVRTFSEATHAVVPERLTRVVDGIAAAHGLTATVDYQRGYPVTSNTPAEVDRAVRPGPRHVRRAGVPDRAAAAVRRRGLLLRAAGGARHVPRARRDAGRRGPRDRRLQPLRAGPVRGGVARRRARRCSRRWRSTGWPRARSRGDESRWTGSPAARR